jgi:hypothetical protein
VNLDKRFNECMSFLSLGLKILPYKRRGKTNKKGRGKTNKKGMGWGRLLFHY